MNLSTVNQLTTLNKQFYSSVANDFSQTRQQPWAGWLKLKPIINSLDTPISILDLACGNGRLATFLKDEVTQPWSYLGIDANQQLIELAKQQTQEYSQRISFLNLDLISSLQNEENFFNDTYHFFRPDDKIQTFDLVPQTPNLVISFGFWHHIPSRLLRVTFLKTLSKTLQPGGTAIITAWQFINNETLMNRSIDSETIGIDADQLEPNDYLLNWQRGNQAIRYCHYDDLNSFQAQLNETNLELQDYWYADGKGDHQNLYVQLQHGC